jgi:toxin ParE1/3/4
VSEYRLRPRAIADLDEIWDYTASTWSEAQAERYLLGLRDALALLSARPELGRARNDLHPGLKVANYSKHLIFYLPEAWGIDVVRVLHGSQDIPALFTRDDSS